jgi:AcrR family transcriptional regulator
MSVPCPRSASDESPSISDGRRLRNRRQREGARRAILDATESVLVEAGPDGLSMRSVASRCGYAAPTIYHYFGDKPGLIDALLEERFSRMLASFEAVARGDDPAGYLAELARAFVRFGTDHPSHYLLLTVRSPGDRPPPPSAERTRGLLEAPLLDLAARGLLRHADCDALLQTLWALLHGLISLTTSRPDYEWSDGIVDIAIETFLNGVMQPDRARRKRSLPAQDNELRASPTGAPK